MASRFSLSRAFTSAPRPAAHLLRRAPIKASIINGGPPVSISAEKKHPSGEDHQYFGMLGSTLSLQARMPPFMLRTFLNPACFRNSTALAERAPLLQWATISSAGFNSLTRFARSPRGISLEPGILQ